LFASILLLPPGEVPEGRARGVQDTATQVQSESETRGPERETGVTRGPKQFGHVTLVVIAFLTALGYYCPRVESPPEPKRKLRTKVEGLAQTTSVQFQVHEVL
jgi:hypothetical protein